MATWMDVANGRLGGVMRRASLLLAWVAGLGLLAAEPARAADEPTPLAGDANVEAILDALKIRGDTLRDFSADVSLTSLDTGTMLSTAQIGHVWYQNDAKTGGRIRVNFDTHKTGDITTTDEKHQYILGGQDLLNGQDLIDIDFKKKRITKERVVKPGQPLNLMKLGEGPFPLPIGQDPKTVQDEFDVTKPAAAKDDPTGTVHLSLAPKKGTSLARKFTSIDIYVDCQTAMPTRIVTVDQSGQELHTTQLDKVQINKGLPANTFEVPAEAKDFEPVTKAYEE
jgi:outer membrane lipoprotein-sorting protein